ncbi:MAG: hypothetical protein M1470_09250 [Bacteroidetes bacterium]|nr:hypothetical protein [Bacteroidota bacterium]MCL5737861.1 hypothetical protein [Bacteroidota bacterium]
MTDTFLACATIWELLSKVGIANWIAVSALLFSVLTFIFSRRFQRKIIRLEKESIWFRHLVVEPHFQDIENFYRQAAGILVQVKDQINRHFEAGKRSEDLEPSLRPQIVLERLADCVNDFGARFLNIVQAVQPKCAEKLEAILEELRRKAGEHLDNLVNGGKPIRNTYLLQLLAKSRIEFIHVLYEHETKYLERQL